MPFPHALTRAPSFLHICCAMLHAVAPECSLHAESTCACDEPQSGNKHQKETLAVKAGQTERADAALRALGEPQRNRPPPVHNPCTIGFPTPTMSPYHPSKLYLQAHA